tara:strand:- start:372 stop:665 length:294 start_codon:yes stop_codon:yes gene_type:complete
MAKDTSTKEFSVKLTSIDAPTVEGHKQVGLILMTAPQSKLEFFQNNFDDILEQLQVHLFHICGLSKDEIDNHDTLPLNQPILWEVEPDKPKLLVSNN